MTLRDSKFTPIAFWLAFLALGFITSFATPSHSPAPARDEVVAERETGAQAGRSAQD
jgi:hypothetical protein